MFLYLVIDDDGISTDGVVCPSVAAPAWMKGLIRDAGELARRMPPWPATVVTTQKGQLPGLEPLGLKDVYALAMFAEAKLSGEMDGAGARFIGEAAMLSLMILDAQHDRQRPQWLDEVPQHLRTIERRQIFASLALARLEAALGLLESPSEQQRALALIGSVAALLMRAGVGVFWQAADELTRDRRRKSAGGSKRQEGARKIRALVLARYRDRAAHFTSMTKEKAAVELAREFFPRSDECGYTLLGATPADQEDTLAGTIRDWLKGEAAAS